VIGPAGAAFWRIKPLRLTNPIEKNGPFLAYTVLPGSAKKKIARKRELDDSVNSGLSMVFQ
jgi:hypothetical protein